MKCPYCRSSDTEVYNTRTTKFGSQIWRRRRCQACHESFTTYEAADLGFLKVVRSKTTTDTKAKPTPYSRAKLYASLGAAFLNPPASRSNIDALTDTIESKLLDLQKTLITTQEIATIVLSTLKHFNTNAFVRYLTSHTELATSSQLKKALGKY